MNVKSQSELDIGGCETCSVLLELTHPQTSSDFHDSVFYELTCTCQQLPEAVLGAFQPQCSEPSSIGAEALDGCGVEIESLLKFYRDPAKKVNR